jgi:crotonobetainyl-CoA:carnitine CoA-transferase CaiB-like acyl-CoA transferase
MARSGLRSGKLPRRRGVIPPFGPLRGLRVLDTGRVVAGPWAATLLADFGAEVIHIEGPPFHPPYADPTRILNPRLPEGEELGRQVSESWVQYGRNKLSLGLDVRHRLGRRVFLDLVRRSDVWIDASRPGTFEKFGLGDRTLWRYNPRLVIVHVTGFGLTGDPRYIHRPCFDIVAQAYSGFLACQGDPEPSPPMTSGTAINDLVTGLAAAMSALLGYVQALRTGRGDRVDVAQGEIFFLMMENMALDYFLRGAIRRRQGRAHPRLHPYEIFPAKDGHIVLAAPTPSSWEKLKGLLNLPPDPEWDDMAWRVAHRAEVNAPIERFTRKHTVAELERIGLEHDIAFAPILDMEQISRHPQYQARNMFLEWDDPVLGRVRGAGIAPKLSRSPGRVWRGAPWLGQDNEPILKGILGYSEPRVRQLVRRGVVGSFPPWPVGGNP